MDKTAAVSGAAWARDAILDAFRDIVLSEGYDVLRVLDVVTRSGVGRSTFYEHFENKEHLLRESVRYPLGRIATLVAGRCDLAEVEGTLEHLQENRNLTRALLKRPGTDVIIEVLADLIAEQSRLMPALRSRAIAGALIAVISAWVRGMGPRSAGDVAQTMREIARAL